MRPPILGVLGGMGPAATADFLAKLAERTPATRDQDHLRTIVYSDPTTPDRSEAIRDGGPSPVPAMAEGVRFLENAGVDLIAIPCNTAHYWFDELAAQSSVPIVHIVDAVQTQIRREAPEVDALGLLATNGTVEARIYHQALAPSGITVLDLVDLGPQNPVMAGIRAMKAGDVLGARSLLNGAIEALTERGAQGVVYGCTDVSAALDLPPAGVDARAWDSANALALACVEHLGRVRR